MSGPDTLRQRISQKILSGELPKQHCRVTWYGFGTGAICLACDQRIPPEDVEVECDLPSGGTIRLHRSCYGVWSTEWPTSPRPPS